MLKKDGAWFFAIALIVLSETFTNSGRYMLVIALDIVGLAFILFGD